MAPPPLVQAYLGVVLLVLFTAPCRSTTTPSSDTGPSASTTSSFQIATTAEVPVLEYPEAETPIEPVAPCDTNPALIEGVSYTERVRYYVDPSSTYSRWAVTQSGTDEVVGDGQIGKADSWNSRFSLELEDNNESIDQQGDTNSTDGSPAERQKAVSLKIRSVEREDHTGLDLHVLDETTSSIARRVFSFILCPHPTYNIPREYHCEMRLATAQDEEEIMTWEEDESPMAATTTVLPAQPAGSTNAPGTPGSTEAGVTPPDIRKRRDAASSLDRHFVLSCTACGVHPALRCSLRDTTYKERFRYKAREDRNCTFVPRDGVDTCALIMPLTSLRSKRMFIELGVRAPFNHQVKTVEEIIHSPIPTISNDCFKYFHYNMPRFGFWEGQCTCTVRPQTDKAKIIPGWPQWYRNGVKVGSYKQLDEFTASSTITVTFDKNQRDRYECEAVSDIFIVHPLNLFSPVAVMLKLPKIVKYAANYTFCEKSIIVGHIHSCTCREASSAFNDGYGPIWLDAMGKIVKEQVTSARRSELRATARKGLATTYECAIQKQGKIIRGVYARYYTVKEKAHRLELVTSDQADNLWYLFITCLALLTFYSIVIVVLGFNERGSRRTNLQKLDKFLDD